MKPSTFPGTSTQNALINETIAIHISEIVLEVESFPCPFSESRSVGEIHVPSSLVPYTVLYSDDSKSSKRK
jgi:hypothetical protein